MVQCNDFTCQLQNGELRSSQLRGYTRYVPCPEVIALAVTPHLVAPDNPDYTMKLWTLYATGEERSYDVQNIRLDPKFLEKYLT